MHNPMNRVEFAVRELDRRLANLAKMGQVHAVCVDKTLPKVRVKMGELVTAWLPFITTRAGSDTTWWPVDVGEQVLVISPSGDLSQGVVMGSLYQNSVPPGSTSTDIVRTDYSDGSVVEYDKANNHFSAQLTDGATIDVRATGGISIVAEGGVSIVGNVSVDGDIRATGNISDRTRSMSGDRSIYNNHAHPGVTPGNSTTSKTLAQQ